MAILGSLSFSVSDLLQLLAIAALSGGLLTQVRQNSKRIRENEERQEKRIEAIEQRQDKHEDRFVAAIEKLGNDFSTFASELRSVIAVHETRLNYMQKEVEKEEQRCAH